MTIPDQAVFASIGTMAAAAVWIGRQFVLSVRKPADDLQSHPRLTVRDYREIVDMLKKDLDDRYMTASEARKHFSNLNIKIEHIGTRVDILIAELGGHSLPFRH